MRNEAKSAIRSLVGTGCDVDLLHFPWLPQGPILDRYDFLFLKRPESEKHQVLVAGDTRNLPPSSSQDLDR